MPRGKGAQDRRAQARQQIKTKQPMTPLPQQKVSHAIKCCGTLVMVFQGRATRCSVCKRKYEG